MKFLNWAKREYIIDNVFLNQLGFLYFIALATPL